MAKATKRPVAPVNPPYELTLELSQVEAEHLFRLTGAAVYDGDGANNNIYQALKKAGVVRTAGSF